MATVHSSKALLALKVQRAIKATRGILVQREIKATLDHKASVAKLDRKVLRATKASKVCKDHKANVVYKARLGLRVILVITLS